MSADDTGALAQIARTLDLLLKLKVDEVRGDRKSQEMIFLLHSYGCTPKEIANALGKTTNDVSPVLSRAKKTTSKKTTSKKTTSKKTRKNTRKSR